MKKIVIRYITGLTVIALLLVNCSVPKDAITSNFRSLPQSFGSKTDTVSAASINWRKYYQDSVLTHLIDTALKNNLDLMVALQHIEMARANIRYAKGLFFPSISLNANTGIQKFGQYTPTWAGNNGTVIYKNKTVPDYVPDFYVGLQSSWEVDVWGKLRNMKRSAVAQYLSGVEGRNWFVTNLVSEIASNYYELLALDNQLDIIDQSVKLQDSALSIVRIQKEAGVANDLGVKQFEAQVLNFQNLKVETLQKIEICENNLNLLLGRFPQPIGRDRNSLSGPIPAELKVGIPSALLKNRPDIRQAGLDVVAAKANVKAAHAAFFPSLNITGTVGYEAFKSSLITSPQSLALNALGGLVAPLVNRSAIKATFNTSKAIQMEALCNYQKSIINGYVEVRNEMTNLKTAGEVLELKGKEVNLLDQSISASIDLFKTGRATYLEILTMQQNILQSKIELVEAQKDQALAVIGLYRSLGGGWQ
jgi:NodT family efflux transporter outer membrane factor (OMF) lipoprotein